MVARAPRKRMYRTMQGRMVDIEKLRAANESVRAVGNMNVNARGDVLGVSGQVVKPKAEVMKTYYEAPRGRVDDTPARNKPAPVQRTAPMAPKPEMKKMTPVAAKPAPKVEAKPEPKKVTVSKSTTTTTEKKGIDAALDGLE